MSGFTDRIIASMAGGLVVSCQAYPGEPLRNDEPTSLLTTDLVGSFLDAARGLQAYQGIKIQTPADATVERRLAMITSIHDVMATA